jgi:hypothetical protein
MANFVLRRTDAARFLAQNQMVGFGLLESRTEGMSATELVECPLPLYWNAPLFGDLLFRTSPTAASLNDRKHGKNHLSAETDRSGGSARFLGCPLRAPASFLSAGQMGTDSFL